MGSCSAGRDHIVEVEQLENENNKLRIPRQTQEYSLTRFVKAAVKTSTPPYMP